MMQQLICVIGAFRKRNTKRNRLEDSVFSLLLILFDFLQPFNLYLGSKNLTKAVHFAFQNK